VLLPSAHDTVLLTKRGLCWRLVSQTAADLSHFSSRWHDVTHYRSLDNLRYFDGTFSEGGLPLHGVRLLRHVLDECDRIPHLLA
jgi:hypothetical protein